MSLKLVTAVNDASNFIKRLGDYYLGRTKQPNLATQRDDCRAYVARYLRSPTTSQQELRKGLIVVVGWDLKNPTHILVVDTRGNVLADKNDGRLDIRAGLYYPKDSTDEPLVVIGNMRVPTFLDSVA